MIIEYAALELATWPDVNCLCSDSTRLNCRLQIGDCRLQSAKGRALRAKSTLTSGAVITELAGEAASGQADGLRLTHYVLRRRLTAKSGFVTASLSGTVDALGEAPERAADGSRQMAEGNGFALWTLRHGRDASLKLQAASAEIALGLAHGALCQTLRRTGTRSQS